MADQETIDALRKSGDFKRWIDGGGNVATELLNHPCPKCGGKLVCGYADMGATDIYDTFAHACVNPGCSYVETKTLFSSMDDHPKPDCPLCDLIPWTKPGP